MFWLKWKIEMLHSDWHNKKMEKIELNALKRWQRIIWRAWHDAFGCNQESNIDATFSSKRNAMGDTWRYACMHRQRHQCWWIQWLSRQPEENMNVERATEWNSYAKNLHANPKWHRYFFPRNVWAVNVMHAREKKTNTHTTMKSLTKKCMQKRGKQKMIQKKWKST